MKDIDSPLNTDYPDDCAVCGYETKVSLTDGEFELDDHNGHIRDVVLQDDARRHIEVSTLYRRINEMERFLSENPYDPFLSRKMSLKQLEIFNLPEVTEEG